MPRLGYLSALSTLSVAGAEEVIREEATFRIA
jgi:hypothetical protein